MRIADHPLEVGFVVGALALAGLALVIPGRAYVRTRPAPRRNPWPAHKRRKWASYANTVGRQGGYGRSAAGDPYTAAPDLDPDSSVDEILDWLAWYDDALTDDVRELADLAHRRGNERKARDLAWGLVGEIADMDEF